MTAINDHERRIKERHGTKGLIVAFGGYQSLSLLKEHKFWKNSQYFEYLFVEMRTINDNEDVEQKFELQHLDISNSPLGYQNLSPLKIQKSWNVANISNIYWDDGNERKTKKSDGPKS